MKNIFVSLVSTFLATSVFAGPIISGGASQILEVCQTESADLKLNISSTIDGNLLLEVVDYSQLKSTLHFNDLVQAEENGYNGLNSRVVFEYVEGVKLATVIIEPQGFSREPLVYQNIICSNQLK